MRRYGSRAKLRAGVCKQCGCTQEAACAPGCSWVNLTRNLCSSCHAENRIVTAIRERPRDITLGAFFAEVMPEGSFDDYDEEQLANAIVGAAAGLAAALAR